MKIRTNYVSNSSSSSFCVLGVVGENDYDYYDDKIYTGNGKTILCIYNGISDYYDSIVIGASPNEMMENETLSEFKERICKDFKEHGIEVKPDELGWIIDGGMDN